jgi:hypothetical protein
MGDRMLHAHGTLCVSGGAVQAPWGSKGELNSLTVEENRQALPECHN